MRKLAFCICENKGYIYSTFPPLSNSENSKACSHLLWLYTARFVSDLVGNPEDRFSQNEAHFFQMTARRFYLTLSVLLLLLTLNAVSTRRTEQDRCHHRCLTSFYRCVGPCIRIGSRQIPVECEGVPCDDNLHHCNRDQCNIRQF